MKTAFKIVLWSLIGISVGLSIWVAVDGGNVGKEELAKQTSMAVCLYWVYTVLGIALLSLIYAAITNFVCRPSGWLKTLISLGVVAVVIGAAVTWALCLGINSADAALIAQHDVGKVGWYLSQTGIFAAIIVAGITVLTVLYSVVNGLVQKATNAFTER
jgi:hypothetical protein